MNKAALRRQSQGLRLERNHASRLLAEKSTRRQEQWHHSTADWPPSRSAPGSRRTRSTGTNQSRFSAKCPLECITDHLYFYPLPPATESNIERRIKADDGHSATDTPSRQERRSAFPSASATCSGVKGGVWQGRGEEQVSAKFQKKKKLL